MAVCINSKKGSISPVLDRESFIPRCHIVILEIGPRRAIGRVYGVVAVAACRASAVGDQNNEGRIRVVTLVQTGEVLLRLLKSGFPVGAGIAVVVVGFGDRSVNSFIEKAVDAGVAAEVTRPRLPTAGGPTKCHHSDLDIVAIVLVLLSCQSIHEAMHDVLGIVGAAAVRVCRDVVVGHAV